MFDYNIEELYSALEAEGWELFCPCKIEDVQATWERFPPWVSIFCQFYPKRGFIQIWTRG